MPADTRRRDRYTRWLEFAQAAASAVTSIADGPLNVPFLKGAADLVYKIIVAAQTANDNQDACDDLVEKIAHYFGIITDSLKGKTASDVGTTFHASVNTFTDELQGTLEVIQGLNSSSRKYISKLANNTRDKKAIEEQKAKLSNAFDRLKLSNIIGTHLQLQEITGKIGDLYSLVSSGFSSLRERLLFFGRPYERWSPHWVFGWHEYNYLSGFYAYAGWRCMRPGVIHKPWFTPTFPHDMYPPTYDWPNPTAAFRASTVSGNNDSESIPQNDRDNFLGCDVNVNVDAVPDLVPAEMSGTPPGHNAGCNGIDMAS